MQKMKDKKEKAFNNWRHNAIHLTFSNGNSISTIWGYLTYSDNHDYKSNEDAVNYFNSFMQSDTCEIAILKAPKKLRREIEKKYDFDEDSVKGYLNIAEWLDILNMLSK